METTATYDAATQEFVIHTPTEVRSSPPRLRATCHARPKSRASSPRCAAPPRPAPQSAQKYLIGNGMTARMGVVFAQLHVGGQCHGLHAFVVPLRDAAGRLLPGVRAAECGLKIGLNGVDNGRFWFSHARVPRAALLNRFADVTPDGRYASKLPSPAMRFAATISALVTGRVSMTLGANNIAKLAVATAVLYGQQRRQFGPPGAPEVPLLDYTIHQSRLMPHLARCLVTSCAAQRLKRLAAAAAAGGGGADAAASRARLMKMLHVAVSGLKAVVTWHMRDALTDCREACGGQGFKADNRVGVARADADAWMTFEGDNFVLLQQVAQEQLKRLQRGVAGQGAAGEELAHLRAEAALQPALRRLAAAMGGDAGVPLDAPDVAGACAALAADPLSQAQQQRALRVLEGDALLRLALRLAQLHRDGRAAWDAWNEAGAEAVECGRAFALRWLLDAYCDDMRELAAVAGGAGGDPLYPRQAGEAAQAPRVTEALALARSVFVLHALLREPAFLRRQFVDAAGLEVRPSVRVAPPRLPLHSRPALLLPLRHGHTRPPQRMSVTLQALQQQLRRHAVPCVRAFGIPQHLLPPIAKDYVAQYSYESARRATEFSGAARE